MKNNIKKRRRLDKFFNILFLVSILLCVTALVILLFSILKKGLGWLTIDFLKSYPSRRPSKAGMLPGIVGSILLIIISAIVVIPIGIGTAIYLEEYANKKSKFSKFVEANISNLAGVPAIVYGMLGLAIFSFSKSFKGSLLAGGITMALLILPVVIVASKEALRTVPSSLKEAAYGLGMNRWQMIKAVVLPYGMPGILTGIILALSRAMGEAAPLIVIGAVTSIRSLPKGLDSNFTAMPIQIYSWISMPKEEFQNVASAGIIVLLIFLLSFNSIAIFLRNKYSKGLR